MNKKKVNLPSSLNFELFWDIFKQKTVTQVECYILLIIFYAQIIIFHIQLYGDSSKYEDDLTFQTLRSITHYLYLIHLIDVSPLIYTGFRITLMGIPIIFFLIYLFMLYATYKNKQFKTIKKLFSLNYTYYSMIIFFPNMEVIIRDICCDDVLLNLMQEQCFQDQHLYYFILAAFSLCCSLIMIILVHIYSFNGLYDKKNLFSGENRTYEILVTIARFILVLTAGFSNSSHWFIILFLVINLLLGVILIAYFIYNPPYNKSVVENTILVCLCIFFTNSLFFFIATARSYDVSINHICTFFAIFMLYKRRKIWAIMQIKIKSTHDLLLLVSNIQQLKNHTKIDTDDELYFRGLLERHLENCKDNNCFCKKIEVFDPKRNKDLPMEKRYYHKSVIIKFFIRQLFEAQLKINKDSDIIISYAEFLFEKFRNVPLSLYQISQLTTSFKFIYPTVRFRIFKLRHKISEYLNTRNQEGLAKPLEIESVIFVEEQFEQVLESMQSIIKAALKFWEYLTNKEIDLNKLNDLSRVLISTVDETNKLWHPLKIYLEKKKKLKYYYNWYLKDFLNKKILLTEEDIEELLEDETASVHSGEFLNNLKNDHIIFQDDTCVIHISGNPMTMGKIIKSNKAVTNVFGYQKEEIENTLINTLMPDLISRNHGKYLESFVQTGKSKLMYSQKQTFGIDKVGFLIPLWAIVKQIDDYSGDVQYAGLVRPLSEKQDEPNYYMIFNEHGEIHGITKTLAKMTMITPNFLKSYGNFNIITLAPKLIKEFTFDQVKLDFLDEDRPGTQTSLNDTLMASGFGGNDDDEKGIKALNKGYWAPFLSMDEEDEYESEDGLQSEEKIDSASKIISFTLRVPKQLPKFIRDMEYLRNKYINDLIRATDLKLNIKRQESLASRNNKRDSLRKPYSTYTDISNLPMKDPLVTTSYLQALQTITRSVLDNTYNNVFRIKAIVHTEYYGSDQDILKYMKVLSINKKADTFKRFDTTINRTNYKYGQKISLKSNDSKKADSDSGSNDQIAKFKNEKQENKLLKEIDPKEENVLDEEGNVSMNVGGGGDQGSEKESKIYEKSIDESQKFKQKVMADMKSGLANVASNLFHKEENFLIHKNLGSLNQVKWFIRLLFFIMIPINIFIFVFGAGNAFNYLKKSSNSIYVAELINRSYLRCHHAIATLILNQTNVYTTIQSSDFNDYINSQVDNMKQCANQLQQSNKDPTWTQLLTQTTESIQPANNILYPDKQFENVQMPTYYVISKLFNAIQDIVKLETDDFTDSNEIISTFRWNSFQNIYLILDTIIYRFIDLVKVNFDTSESMSVIILIVEGTMFAVSFMIILKLIFNVIYCLRIILEVFSYIDLQNIKETEWYYRRLKSFFKTKKDKHDGLNADASTNTKIGGKIEANKNNNAQKPQKKLRLAHAKGFLRQTRFKILAFYFGSILASSALSLIFHFTTKDSITKLTDLVNNGEDFISMSSYPLKLLVSVEEYLINNNTYSLNVFPFITDTLTSSEKFIKYSVFPNPTTTFEEVYNKIYFSNACDGINSAFTFNSSNDYRLCQKVSIGKLTGGLIIFQDYFFTKVEDSLYQNTDLLFGAITPTDLYNFEVAVEIIDYDMSQNLVELWKNNILSILTDEETKIIILLVVVSVLNVVVFFIAENLVIGTLYSNYMFFRDVYNRYMLVDALQKEKRIKAILVKMKMMNK